ncbi:MAG: beta-ketoacyl-ACP synthase III [Phycisphaerales bacterium]
MTHSAHADAVGLQPVANVGVRICGTGSFVPDRKLTNTDFEKLVDTSDEWIFQRTGIRERRIATPEKGENTVHFCSTALGRALEDARMPASDLDCIIVGTVTPDMTCPSTACQVSARLGGGHAAAFDVTAACSGFVYSLTVAHSLIRAGTFRAVGVVGCDVMSKVIDYTDRRVSILFGDAAGAAVIKATDDTTRGMLAQRMHADGSGWQDLYLPRLPRDFPEGEEITENRLGKLQMNGREVFKFAVRTFSEVIEQCLQKAGVQASDVDHYVCHQSNARILESARERFGLPEDKIYVNIDRYGNSSAGSVGLCFDQLRKSGKVHEGQLVMFVAFGGGLTWAASLWRL